MSEPKRSFLDGFAERTVFEAELNGYCANGVVQLATGESSKDCFYDPVKLGQDRERKQGSGEVCIAEPGLMAIPNDTLYAAHAASRGHDVSFEN